MNKSFWEANALPGWFEKQTEVPVSGTGYSGAHYLFHSRRFAAYLFGILVALALYFVSKRFSDVYADVKFIFDLTLPLTIMLLASYTISDVAETLARMQDSMHKADLNAQNAQQQWMVRFYAAEKASSGGRVESHPRNPQTE